MAIAIRHGPKEEADPHSALVRIARGAVEIPRNIAGTARATAYTVLFANAGIALCFVGSIGGNRDIVLGGIVSGITGAAGWAAEITNIAVMNASNKKMIGKLSKMETPNDNLERRRLLDLLRDGVQKRMDSLLEAQFVVFVSVALPPIVALVGKGIVTSYHDPALLRPAAMVGAALCMSPVLPVFRSSAKLQDSSMTLEESFKGVVRSLEGTHGGEVSSGPQRA